jgi:hypothetical protein
MEQARAQIKNRQQYPFLMIPKAFFTRYEPTYRAILTYTALSYYAENRSGSCEGITLKTLAARVAISESTMMRGMAELVRKEVVTVHRRSRKNPKTGELIPLPNLYELTDLQPDGTAPI